MPQPSVNMSDELLKEIDEVVESSHVYENRSHLMRVGARMLLEEESDEFGQSG